MLASTFLMTICGFAFPALEKLYRNWIFNAFLYILWRFFGHCSEECKTMLYYQIKLQLTNDILFYDEKILGIIVNKRFIYIFKRLALPQIRIQIESQLYIWLDTTTFQQYFYCLQMQKTTDQPLLMTQMTETNRSVGQVVVPTLIVEGQIQNKMNQNLQNDATLQAKYSAQSNQPYLVNPYPSIQQPSPNQGYPPGQVYQGQPIMQGQPMNQGYQPAVQIQYAVVPPPPPQIIISLPGGVTKAHPQYSYIVQQYSLPCSRCSFVGANFVSLQPGCVAISWAIALFCLTGIFCFWIPLVSSGCKDIVISCSRCGMRKAVVQKQCI